MEEIAINLFYNVSGALSTLLLHGLHLLKVSQVPLPDSVCLSPSFYQPACLESFTKFFDSNSSAYYDFQLLKSQFNHFDSWIFVPEYEVACLSYLATSDRKADYIKFARNKLKNGDKVGAISVLEKCMRDSWPDIYRCISKFHYSEIKTGFVKAPTQPNQNSKSWV